jgi:putative serine protease PepD
MTEYETDPHRQPASSDASASNSGTSQQTAGLPWQAPAATPSGEAERSSAVPASPTPVSVTSPAPAGSTPAGAYAAPASEWQQPGNWQAGQWQSTESGYQAPQDGSYSTPSYPGSTTTTPNPSESGYPGSGYPVEAGTGSYPTTGAAYQPGWPSAPGAGIPPQQPPFWGQPGEQQPRRKPGKTLAGVAAVLALAVGSGVLGGWVALQNDSNTTTTANAASNTTISSPPPVINRSDLATVASAVQGSVVTIITGSGEGSGVVYDNSGHIVTNNHVVATATGNTVQVNFNNGTKATATIVGTDPKSDLAVIKVANASGLKAAKFGDSGAMRVGDTVLAIGSPLDLEGTVTAGIVSALDRTIQVGSDQQQQDPFSQQQQSQATSSISGLMQTDAPINPGNSGGALVNTNGEVIGINSAIATSGSSTGNIGVGFAIPSNKVKVVADQLIKGGKVSHPFLGVSVGNGQSGALVQSVTSGSPAAKAGLQQGDVITKIGNKSVSTSDDVVSAVQAASVGDKLDLTYTRNGQQKTATVTLAEAS